MPDGIDEKQLISVRSNPGDSIEGIGSRFDERLKATILWIYNINQNGTSNKFREEVSQYFSTKQNGNAMFRDMSPEMLAEFLKHLSAAKEAAVPGLDLRLILLIYNCNQNGTSNTAEVAAETGS
ncbi:MAG: hypothetical protein H0Z39_04205 [Peptococcaceae bacterium]|nr:hypothetical protein [Peptococcaceae bacterium]